MNKHESASSTQERPVVLVVGITGSFGGAVARALADRPYRLKALVRDIPRAQSVLNSWDTSPAVEWIAGDALDADAVNNAMEGADILVYGFNVAYPKWDPLALQAAEIAFSAAEKEGATVLLPGNVYGLTPGVGLAEDAPQDAVCRKGALRNKLEARLERACDQGARAIVLRCGDFFGPEAPAATSWFAQLVSKAANGTSAITYPGPEGVRHAFAYLPDVGRAAAGLLDCRASLQPFEVFHFSGQVVDRAGFGQGVRKALESTPPSASRSERKLKGFPWLLIGCLRPFSAMIRELWEMRYLWDQEVLLDDAKLRALLGQDAAPTPFPAAAAATVAALRH